MPILKAEPDWLGSAQAFVAGLEAQPTLDGQVEFIDACRAEFGDRIYPAFVKLLAAVAAFGDDRAKSLCAEALSHALATARLPTTKVAAWGAGGGLAELASLGRGGLATHLRAVGPIEFLCIWLTREVIDEPLDEAGFQKAMTWLLILFNASDRAANLYRAKLEADADNPMEGLHSQESRRLVRALTAAWAAGAEPREIAIRAAAARGGGRHDPFAGLIR